MAFDGRYNRIYCPTHPNATKAGFVYEHRLVIEKILGRYLRKDEKVHHRNGNQLDNRPENLEVLSSSEHTTLHWKEGKFAKNCMKRPNPKPCQHCGAIVLRHIQNKCMRCYSRDRYRQQHPESPIRGEWKKYQ